MATTIDNVVLVFTARGAQRVARSINEVGFSSAKAANAAGLLQGALGGLGAALAVRQVVAYADSYTELQNRLRLVTETSDGVAVATQNIFDIASRTRGNIEETSRTYFRFARANERLGLSEQELLDITETVNQAVAFSGTSAESASSALFQFSQGIAAGTLRGQELNSVLEQIPGLAEVLAKGLGVGVDQLRKMGEQGRLTGRALAQALLSQREFAGEQFGRVIFTVSQEFEGLRTEVIRYIGQVDQALGASRALAKGIRWLALNLDEAAKVASIAGALIFRSLAIQAVRGVAILTAALVANPFGALVAGASLAISTLVAFREDITLAAADGATLGTAMEVAFFKIRDAAKAGFEIAKKALDDFLLGFRGEQTAGLFNQFGRTLNDLLSGTQGNLRQWANVAIGLLTLPVRVAINSFQRLPAALGDLFFQALEGLRQIIIGQFNWEQFVQNITNFFINAFKKAFNFVIEAGRAAFNALKDLSFDIDFDKILDTINQGFEDFKAAPVVNPFEGAAAEFADGFVKVFTDTVNRDFIGDAGIILERFKTEFVKPFLAEVAKTQAAKDAAASGETPLRKPSTEGFDVDATTATLEQIKEIESLTNRFQATGDKLRDGLDLLREYRDEVARFGKDTFGVTVEEVDAAITELERRISGTTDLTRELFIGAAEAARSALVDVLIDPLNASFKDLARGFVQTMQRIVAEAIAAEAVLAALNFIQGFVGFRVPGATATPRPSAGSALGGDIIGGQARLVGERGPEVIVPAQRSTVIPNSDLGGNQAGMRKLEGQMAALAKAVSNMPAPQVINVNEQDPAALISALNTREGAKVQRNFVATDARQTKRILGVR